MALQLYVGPLSRFYAGDWPGARPLPKVTGYFKQFVEGKAPTAARVLPMVEAWREALARGLSSHLSLPLHWEEDAAGDSYVAGLPERSRADLLLWAAYEENPEWILPEEPTPTFADDPAFQASSDPNRETAFPHLLRHTEFWLPYRGAFTFRGQDLLGRDHTFGSAYALYRELIHLNQRTWKASTGTLAEWRMSPPGRHTPIEAGAQFAFATYYQMAETAALNNLPLLLT